MMTWKEFKDAVEEQDVTDSDVFDFIDVNSEDVEVTWDTHTSGSKTFHVT